MDTFDICVEEDPRAGIQDVMQMIRPTWKSENIVIKPLAGGFVNRMYMCTVPDDVDHKDAILIRVNGAGTEGFVDRENELLIMRMVHRAGYGSEVYCRFQNGLAYKFLRGTSLTADNVGQDVVARAVAKKFAGLHLINIRETLAAIGEGDQTEQFMTLFNLSGYTKLALPLIPDTYDDAVKAEIRRTEFPNMEDVLSMVLKLEEELWKMDFPIRFCHRDPNPSNIVYEPRTGEVHLVDWEFSGVHSPTLDIGVYFAGVILFNDCAEGSLALYPEKTYQLQWIRWYLEYQAEQTGKDPDGITEDQVLHLYKGSINCALQWLGTCVTFFLRKDALPGSDQNYFRRARKLQRLFNTILDQHYQHLSRTLDGFRKDRV